MMDRNFGFGRLEPLAATSMAASAPAVTTALAEELFCLHRSAMWRAPRAPCTAQPKPVPSYAAAAA
jgi:hypothetical protein